MGKKRTWRWVTRDWVVRVWPAIKPKPTPFSNCHGGDWWEQAESDCAAICSREFKRLTGITVPTDRPIKVEFTARIVE